jgi:hypothetical protein
MEEVRAKLESVPVRPNPCAGDAAQGLLDFKDRDFIVSIFFEEAGGADTSKATS